MLILALLLNLLLVVLPHLPTINPDFKPVGVDVILYKSFLEEAEDAGLIQALANGGMGRPLYLMLVYWLWASIGKNTVLLMDLLHPLAALTGLALISFYVARKINGEEAVSWAALLIISFSVGAPTWRIVMRKEMYAVIAALLISLSVLLVALQPQTVIGQYYAVGGEIVTEAPSPELFLTSQTVMAIMAIAAAAAAAGILVYNKRRT